MREVRLRRFGDLAYRFYYAGLQRSRLLRLRFRAIAPSETHFLRALKSGIAESMPQFVEHFDRRESPKFYFDADDSSSVPSEVRQAASDSSPLFLAADAILQQRFRSLGGPEFHFDEEVDWMHCMNSEGRWPAVHWTAIDYRRLQDLGDVKGCWEWNRHHSFVTLGRAYQHSGDERYVEKFVELLESWCRQNPPEIGVNYVSNLEIGLRTVSWLWAHHLMSPSESYSAEARGRLHLFLYFMARHLAKNIRYTEFTGRNNHLIGDAACLAVWCLMYPEVRESQRWLKRSLNILWQSVTEQIRPDGMHFELSFGYHLFVVELILQVVILLRRQGYDIPADVESRLESAMLVVKAAEQPDGTLPNFNDNDDGFVWALHEEPRQRVQALLQIGECLFDRTELSGTEGTAPSEQAYWILGRKAPVADATISELTEPNVVQFEDSGLCIFKGATSDANQFALINNHPDPFPNSGHNHASLLQLLLWIDGDEILCDGGTYRYSCDDGFRNALRGTRAHNTVVVDDYDQAEPNRNFGWTTKLRPGLSTCKTDDGCTAFDGVHDSYYRLPQPVRHRRTIVWIHDPCLWIVRDELTGVGKHDFRQMWHIPGEHNVVPHGFGVFRVACSSGRETTIQSLVRPGTEIDIHRGLTDKKWSWESRRYGELRPRTSLSIRWSAAMPSRLVTLFYPAGTAAAAALPIQQTSSGGLTLWDGRWMVEFQENGVECRQT